MSDDISGTSTIMYFEGNALQGTRSGYSCGYARADGQRYSGHWPNVAYFCPTCGEIWGRAVYDHHFQYNPIPQSHWVTETRRCVEHGDGLFLSGFGNEHLPSCSRELLKREALILCLINQLFKE